MTTRPVAIVSAVLLKKGRNGETCIYLQERWKPKTSPTYSGMIEIPAGGIEGYENVYDALRREVKEECGLDVVKIIDDIQSDVYAFGTKDESFAFRPFLCQQVLRTNGGLPWIGFVFVCEVRGKVSVNKNEARNPQWMPVAQLKEIMETHPESFFPLQLPVLKYFVETRTVEN